MEEGGGGSVSSGGMKCLHTEAAATCCSYQVINLCMLSYPVSSLSQLSLYDLSFTWVYWHVLWGGEVILCILFGQVSPTSLGMSVPCKSFPTTFWHLPLICNQRMIHNFTVVILTCNVEWRMVYGSSDVHYRWTRLLLLQGWWTILNKLWGPR